MEDQKNIQSQVQKEAKTATAVEGAKFQEPKSSDSTLQTKEETLPATTGKQLVEIGVQEPDNIKPVRPNHVDDARDAELKRQAEEAVSVVLSNPSSVRYTAAIYNLGKSAMQENTSGVALLDAKVSDVMKEIEFGSPTEKTLTQIKTNLEMINPAVISRMELPFLEKTFLGLFTKTVRRLPKAEEVLAYINERKDTVKETLDSLKISLRSEKDQILRDMVELSTHSDTLYDVQVELQESAYVGQMIWAKLNDAKAGESDPVRQQALTSLISDLAMSIVDIQTVDTLNVQSRLAGEALINNARKLGQGIDRVNNVLLPSVSNNLAVKAVAARQAQIVDTLNDITRASERTIQDTAKQTRHAIVETERRAGEAMINPQVLEAAANEMLAGVAEVDAIRSETEQNARRISETLTEVAGKMRSAADSMTRARQAREAGSES